MSISIDVRTVLMPPNTATLSSYTWGSMTTNLQLFSIWTGHRILIPSSMSMGRDGDPGLRNKSFWNNIITMDSSVTITIMVHQMIWWSPAWLRISSSIPRLNILPTQIRHFFHPLRHYLHMDCCLRRTMHPLICPENLHRLRKRSPLHPSCTISLTNTSMASRKLFRVSKFLRLLLLPLDIISSTLIVQKVHHDEEDRLRIISWFNHSTLRPPVMITATKMIWMSHLPRPWCLWWTRNNY